MPADDSLLFIDANKYLDLYRIHQGKNLLAPLGEQVDYIFVTQQVVSEVQRNKILVAADFLKQKSKELKLQTFNLPDHLSSTSINRRDDILRQMREISQKIKDVNTEVDALVVGIIEQISRSEDEVSKALSPIFANAVPHSPEELQRARDRRELGNPPGKITNPIGDQLTWEQILTHFKEKGKKRLWIISRDGDYGTVYGGKGFLNRFLYDELRSIASEPEVYLFEDMVKGIEHFVDTTGVKAEKRLTPEEVEEIEKEEKFLPYVSRLDELMRRNIADLGQQNVFGGLSRIIADLEQQNVGGLSPRIMADLGQQNVFGGLSRIIADLERQNVGKLSRIMADLERQNVGKLSRIMADLDRHSTSTHQSLRTDRGEKDEHPSSPPPSEKSDREEKKGDEGKTE